MKKIITMIICIVMVAAVFAGCGASQGTAASSQPTQSAAAGDKPYIAIVSMGFQHQFWQAVKKGAEQAAGELGATITFEGPESETMVDKQVEILKAALAKKPKAVCIAAIDTQAVLPDLQAAAKDGIKIIGFDAGVGGDVALTTCATDNTKAAALAAENMAKLIGNEGEVGMIVHSQTAIDGALRRDGFKDYIEKNCPKIKIVDIQYADGDQLKSADAAKAMMQAYPNIKGIYGSNEGSAIGVMNGVVELNKVGKIIVVGFDSGALIKNGIKDGKMAGAITQDPIGIGYKSIEYSMKAIKGEKLPATVDTGAYWYDKTNIDSDKIAPLLYD